MRYDIYHIDGTLFAQTSTLEYSGELMGDRSITISLKSPTPLDFQVGDYVVYRDEKFSLQDIVGIKKTARKESYGEAFEYSNIKLYSFVGELKNCLFLNITYTNESTNPVGGSLASKFTFHANNVMDIASRLQANLNRFYGNGTWQVKVLAYVNKDDEEPRYINANQSAYKVVGKQNIEVDINDISCFDALRLCYDTFGVQYVVDKGQRVIRLCTQGNTIDKVFSYGKGNGLRSIEKTIDTDHELATVLHVYGSDKNMPQHYYYNKSKLVLSKDKWMAKGAIKKAAFNYIQNGLCVVFKMPSGIVCNLEEYQQGECYLRGIKCKFGVNVSKNYDTYVLTEDMTEEEYEKVAIDIAVANAKGEDLNMSILIPNDYIESCPNSMKVYTLGGDPNLLPINTLMLPSFNSNNLNPTIEDQQAIMKYGRIEKVLRYDSENEDEGLEEIYPTIENLEGSKVSIGSNIGDDGVFDSKATIPNFTITIGDLGFDLNDTRPDGQSHFGKLCVKDGMCGGREFEIVKYDKYSFQLTLKRVEDSALNVWFPTKDFPIKNGDSFVITEIEMPDTYVQEASKRMQEKATEWLKEHNHPKYLYSIAIDNLFMARQHDISTKEESYYWNIKEGDVLNLGADADLEHDNELVTIDKLTIKESADKVPEFSVSLRNEKKRSIIASIKHSLAKVRSSADTANKIASSKSDITMEDVRETSIEIAIQSKNI